MQENDQVHFTSNAECKRKFRQTDDRIICYRGNKAKQEALGPQHSPQ